MITIKIKIFNGKKAQAAMEFLTTYGWAILILIIVVVALANLGIFRAPQTPNTCTVRAPFACIDVIVDTGVSPIVGLPLLWPSNATIRANNVATLGVGNFVNTAGGCSNAVLVGTFNGNGDNIIGLTCPVGVASDKAIGSFDLTYTLIGGGGPHTTTVSFSATRE